MFSSCSLGQGSATYSTRARLGTRSDFEWHAEDTRNGCIQCVKTFIVYRAYRAYRVYRAYCYFLVKPGADVINIQNKIYSVCVYSSYLLNFM